MFLPDLRSSSIQAGIGPSLGVIFKRERLTLSRSVGAASIHFQIKLYLKFDASNERRVELLFLNLLHRSATPCATPVSRVACDALAVSKF